MTTNQNLSDFVRTALQDANAGPQFVKNADFYIRRAVVNLQDQGMLPYNDVSFIARERKNTFVEGKQEINYFSLPDDFAEVELFLVDGLERYYYTADAHLVRNKAARQSQSLFTVDFLDANNRSRRQGKPVLVAYPFPKDDAHIRVKYMSNGTDTDLSQVDHVYFEPVLNEVMRIVGIRPSDMTNDEAYSRSARHKGPKGRRQANRTLPVTKPKFFANAPQRRRRTRTISTRYSQLTFRNRDDT